MNNGIYNQAQFPLPYFRTTGYFSFCTQRVKEARSYLSLNNDLTVFSITTTVSHLVTFKTRLFETQLWRRRKNEMY